jgi:hypothetical protein
VIRRLAKSSVAFATSQAIHIKRLVRFFSRFPDESFEFRAAFGIREELFPASIILTRKQKASELGKGGLLFGRQSFADLDDLSCFATH